LTVPASLGAAAAVSLGATAGLTALGVRVVIGASTLTAVPAVTIGAFLGEFGAVSLAASAALSAAAGGSGSGATTLVATATFCVVLSSRAAQFHCSLQQ
jgi:hypothetical protein